MTADSASSPTLASERQRPSIHFTADNGWINDPYGAAWIDDRYHLYYQAVPGRVTWGPRCTWGHAESPDLVHWAERPPALVPGDFEVGCWSGSVVPDVTPPRLFYTRVAGENLELGQVATATPGADGETWRTSPEDVVVDGPPPHLRLRAFRDPNVLRVDDGWVMLLAAGLTDGAGAVLQYRSNDLAQWTYDGILCSRPNNIADEVWTGGLWECPQLFPLGDRWVLMFSVWNDTVLHHVAAAQGHYDGHRFEPETWQQLTRGACAYAMSALVDKQGRRCVISWLREEPQNNEELIGRAGAHSVVSVVSIDPEGMLVLHPHPDLDAIRKQTSSQRTTAGVRWDVGAAAADLVLDVGTEQRCDIYDDRGVRAMIETRPAERALTIDRTGFPAARLVLPPRVSHARILIDADILEVFAGHVYGAYRILPAHTAGQGNLVIRGPGSRTATVHLLVP